MLLCLGGKNDGVDEVDFSLDGLRRGQEVRLGTFEDEFVVFVECLWRCLLKAQGHFFSNGGDSRVQSLRGRSRSWSIRVHLSLCTALRSDAASWLADLSIWTFSCSGLLVWCRDRLKTTMN